MIISSDLIKVGVGMLTKYLLEGVVEVKFTKQDGSERVMNCTKLESLIPADKLPQDKYDFDGNLIVKEEVEKPLQLITVFDTDKQEWRSFNYTTIKSIKLQSLTGL